MALALLVKVLKQPTGDCRLYALRSIGEMGIKDMETATLIREFLRDKRQPPEFRESAARAFQQSPKAGEMVVDDLLDILQQPWTEELRYLRFTALITLYRLKAGTTRVLPILITLLDGKDEHEVASAIVVIGRIGSDPTKAAAKVRSLLSSDTEFANQLLTILLFQQGRPNEPDITYGADAMAQILGAKEALTIIRNFRDFESDGECYRKQLLDRLIQRIQERDK